MSYELRVIFTRNPQQKNLSRQFETGSYFIHLKSNYIFLTKLLTVQLGKTVFHHLPLPQQHNHQKAI